MYMLKIQYQINTFWKLHILGMNGQRNEETVTSKVYICYKTFGYSVDFLV